MATHSTIQEIQTYKVQLDDLLSKKYVDQSLLLGFNNVLQSRFQTLILSDCNDYYDNLKALDSQSGEVPNNQRDLEFKTIKIFEILWTEFHYPIIKFFQFHHATYYNSFSKKVLESNGKDKSLRAVEIRKINDNSNKFMKQVYQFYFTLLKHFATHFQNPLVPDSFLKHFEFTVPNNAIKTKFNVNLQANLIFLIHRCLISLGDISRHRSFIDISYVKPCLSMKNFWKFHHINNLASEEKFSTMKPLYEKALVFYKFCILLLPALNEPYNHIGMIYNLMDNKYEACYWFLRSQFTRLPNYKLGLTNLSTILKKEWFINCLINIYSPNKKGKIPVSKKDELNIEFICIICYYYLPEYYQKSNNTIVRNLKYSKIESDFFNTILQSSNKLSRVYDEDNINIFTKQLVILMSFNKLIELNNDKALSEQLIKFTFRYIKNILDAFALLTLDDENKKTILTILRLLCNWFKENKIILRNFQSRKPVVVSMIKLLNIVILEHYDNSQINRNICQEEISNLIKLNSRPSRDYYFVEDVCLRDFLIIKFQLKDFKDDHIFVSNNINLLIGDYSDLIDESTLVPSFFDNNLYKQMMDNNAEKNSNSGKQVGDILDTEILRYENDLRLKSVTLMSKKLLELNPYGIEFDFTECKYSIKQNSTIGADKVEVKDSQDEKIDLNEQAKALELEGQGKGVELKEKGKGSGNFKKEKRIRIKSEGKRAQENVQVENSFDEAESEEQLSMKIPNTLQELNSFILNHSSQLQDSLLHKDTSEEILTQDPRRDVGLKNMVDSLVQESSKSEPKSNSSTPNIWKDEGKAELIPENTQPVNMLNPTPFISATPSDYILCGPLPPPPQMPQLTQGPPNYSQVFQNTYYQYMPPFSNQLEAGSTPYYHAFNDGLMPTSSQLLLQSIHPSLQQRPQAPQSPMPAYSSSPLPAIAYPQYPHYNQFIPMTQMQLPPPPSQLQAQGKSKLHANLPYPS